MPVIYIKKKYLKLTITVYNLKYIYSNQYYFNLLIKN